ncbi:hypothetical protein [Candidatus Marinarcus aquaticus]|uniref:hypothetical protein n=1 Tax=Candidatus Marinarcus aquaticus TaxID=2044504 RepID=UPI00100C0B2C|nr:hypothetical protein [Candidatus Marinarcus aquaticus]
MYAYSELYESDLYYLDKNEVLLYKILNWWGIESHEESTEFCFNSIKVRSNKTLQVSYDTQLKTLKIDSKKKFAHLLSVFENKHVYLKNEYINSNYFQKVKAENIQKINTMHLKNVTVNEYEKIKKNQKNLAFELEGKVAGLLSGSGKLSLHRNGDFLRSCPHKEKETFDIVFKLLNIKTKEVVAQYLLKE